MNRRSLRAYALGVTVLATAISVGAATSGRSSIRSADLREWLTYIASDELEGRAVYSTGLGLAAAYIETHLRTWGALPAGGNGSYLQTVRVLGVKSSNHSTITIEVDGQTRTFMDGQGIRFPSNVGGKRHLTVDRVEFVGSNGNRDVSGAAVVLLGPSGRNPYAIQQLNAVASLSPESMTAPTDSRTGGTAADFTTVQRLDQPVAPSVSAGDAFFTLLFSHAPVKYEELRRKADLQEPLSGFRLDGVRLTFDLDADYQVVRTQLSQNVVAIVEGIDPRLKNTYVAFGAHYDHLGYAEGAVVNEEKGPVRLGAPGRVSEGAIDDRIWNGADDDGSGTVALMALVQAFVNGPRPKRSLLFVWHTGEERGLWGSRYFVDYPTVPLDHVVAQLNIDMIGRNRNDRRSEGNTVYVIGSDRISSELDAINRTANASLPRPMMLDYEMNDPADPERLYFRSDHYSYAAKGIPIIFFTTGLHPDYHANTDEVARIEFEKMTRIVQLIYETGARVANLDHVPLRDNKGPRAGKTAN